MKGAFPALLLATVAASGCDQFGCGPAYEIPTFDVAGSYAGVENTAGACQPNLPLTGGGDAGWKVTHAGSGVSVDTADACSPLTASVVGDTGTVAQKTCTAVTLLDGGKRTDTVTGGSIAFRADDISFTLKLAVTLGDSAPLGDGGVYEDGGKPECSGLRAGTLKRK